MAEALTRRVPEARRIWEQGSHLKIDTRAIVQMGNRQIIDQHLASIWVSLASIWQAFGHFGKS